MCPGSDYLKLYEYMAKETFARYGIPVPAGSVVESAEEAEQVAGSLGGPVALKSQVLSGGRGKAGGIQFAPDPAAARKAAAELLGSTIQGLVVDRLLVEEQLFIEHELYLGLIIDPSTRGPLIIASRKGGVDIEEVPGRDIVRERVDVRWGLFPYQVRSITSRMGISGRMARQFGGIAMSLYRLFRGEDAVLTEINPLAATTNGLVAADGRLTMDDDSAYRHPEVPDTHQRTEIEEKIAGLGLSYVPLDGRVAIMANGAGATMATMDILEHFGSRAMNFLDVGGGASGEKMTEALKTLAGTDPDVILINVFGGITRCDEVAESTREVYQSGALRGIPLVVRLVGTNEEEGREILREAGISAHHELLGAAREAAALGGGTATGGDGDGDTSQ